MTTPKWGNFPSALGSVGRMLGLNTGGDKKAPEQQDQHDENGPDPTSGLGDEANEESREAASHIRDMMVIYESRPSADEEVEGKDDRTEDLPFQKQVRRIVKNWKFDYLISVLIFADSICSAIETDNPDDENDFIITMITLNTFLFTLELFLRGYASPSNMCEFLFLFDAVIVLVSVIDVIARVATAGEDHKMGFLRGLRVFRLMRAFRMFKVLRLPPLRMLIEAVQKSVQPLLIVLTLCALLIFAFAVMMTNLVPEVAEEGEEVSNAAFKYYGSVAHSARTLLEVVDGSGACVSDSVLALFESAREGNMGSIIMLIARIFAAFVLFLAFSGLVTGIFVEQLFGVHQRMKDEEQQKELQQRHDCLMKLEGLFSEAGYPSDARIPWAEIKRILERHDDIRKKLDVTMDDASRLFTHLDHNVNGHVVTDEYIFSFFKLKAVSKSIDTLSIDYQQEKNLHRLSALQQTLRICIAGIQSRLTGLASLLPQIKDKIEEVTRGIDEVSVLEGQLVEARRIRDEAEQGACNPEEAMSFALNIDMLRSNYQLNERLSSLEEELAELQALPEGPTSMTPAMINAIADDVVRSVKQALQEELAAAKADPRIVF